MPTLRAGDLRTSACSRSLKFSSQWKYLWLRVDEQRVHAAVQLDRIMRLDAGTATERIALVDSLTDAQLEAVARSMSSGRKR